MLVMIIKSFNVSSQDSNPKDVHFKPDGFKMFVIGSASKVFTNTLFLQPGMFLLLVMIIKVF